MCGLHGERNTAGRMYRERQTDKKARGTKVFESELSRQAEEHDEQSGVILILVRFLFSY